jgi:hypothetical protein
VTITDDENVFDAVNRANGITPDFASSGEVKTELNLGQKTDDPEAPYGRTKSGVPRRKPGRPSNNTGPGIPRPTKRASPKTAKKTVVDYRPGILGILQIPAFALGAAGQFNETFALDGAALSMHAPGIAEALNELADSNPAVAAALDRILAAGPYGAIIGACLPLAMQIAANHKRIPDMMARGAGAMPRDEFREMLLKAQS